MMVIRDYCRVVYKAVFTCLLAKWKVAGSSQIPKSLWPGVRKGIHVNLITYNKLKQDNKKPKKTKIISCTINTSVLFCGGRLISLTVTFCKKDFIQATKVVKIKLGIIDEC